MEAFGAQTKLRPMPPGSVNVGRCVPADNRPDKRQPGQTCLTAGPRTTSLREWLLLGLIYLCSWHSAAALTLGDLEADPKLTPKRFANHFEHFAYEPFVYVQNPNVFLRNRRGDCDDYAILADHVLKQKGYGTRLIHVRMVGLVGHAVCYVTESRAYLDYNSRRYFINLDRSGPSIREIATKVAASFKANWTSASQFTYSYREDAKVVEITVVKTDPPGQDPDRR
jgi:hypothetical protein